MSDRRLWLDELCLSCGARPGLRCLTSRFRGKPTGFLHSARGWRQRPCPACKAPPGEMCWTPGGRQAAKPHSARLHPGRHELFADQQVWQEVDHWHAASALVRFSGGGGSDASIGAVTLEDEAGREVGRWGAGEGELPEALAAPIWARYALFRGHPRITGLVTWEVRERQVLVGGRRGDREFEEALVPKPLARAHLAPLTLPGGAQ